MFNVSDTLSFPFNDDEWNEENEDPIRIIKLNSIAEPMVHLKVNE